MDASRRRVLLWTLAALALLALGLGAWQVFGPEPSQRLDETAPEGTVLLRGSFRDGDPGHDVSGTVELRRDAEGLVLHFADYEATPGPAVYFYLTKGGLDTAAVEQEGAILPTQVPNGQATLRGTFNVRVPDGIDATQYSAIAAWCERFNVLFGAADLA